MTEQEFKNRTKQIALRVINLVESLPRTRSAEVIGKQLLRSGTSIGANYRAACRAKSTADLLHKLAIVEEEADETAFWLELIIEGSLLKRQLVEPLLNEANELTRIMASSRITAKLNANSGRMKIDNRQSAIENQQ